MKYEVYDVQRATQLILGNNPQLRDKTPLDLAAIFFNQLNAEVVSIGYNEQGYPSTVTVRRAPDSTGPSTALVW